MFITLHHSFFFSFVVYLKKNYFYSF
jgi:V-type H+-transporting ATPase subunit a